MRNLPPCLKKLFFARAIEWHSRVDGKPKIIIQYMYKDNI